MSRKTFDEIKKLYSKEELIKIMQEEMDAVGLVFTSKKEGIPVYDSCDFLRDYSASLQQPSFSLQDLKYHVENQRNIKLEWESNRLSLKNDSGIIEYVYPAA